MSEALITRRGGSGLVAFSHPYNGVDLEILDQDGNEISVAIGDKVYIGDVQADIDDGGSGQIIPRRISAKTVTDVTATVAGTLEFVSPVVQPIAEIIQQLTDNSLAAMAQKDNINKGGQTFIISENVIDGEATITIKIAKVGTPTGNLSLIISEVSPQTAVGLPTATVIATSTNTKDASTLTTDTAAAESVEFSFTGLNLDKDTFYAFYLEGDGAISSSNYVIGRLRNTTAYPDGRRVSYNGSTWASVTQDFNFNIIMRTTAVATGFISSEDLIT